MLKIIEIVLLFFIPFLIVKNSSAKIVSTFSVAGVSYIAGILFSILISVLNIFSLEIERFDSAYEIISYAAIALAIPILLFKYDLKDLGIISRKTVTSFMLLIVSAIAAVTAVYFAVASGIENGKIISGMALALYTGGTPNLNAIAVTFGLDSNVIGAANIADMMFGGLFFLFLLFFAKPLVSRVLKSGETNDEADGTKHETSNGIKNEKINNIVNKQKTGGFEPAEITNDEKTSGRKTDGRETAKALFLSVLILILSVIAGVVIFKLFGTSQNSLENYLVPSLMIGSTAFGIIGSLKGMIDADKADLDGAGQYLVSLFSFAIASLIDIESIFGIYIRMIVIFGMITVLTFVIHMILCRLGKISADVMIVTSTAGIFGPAFIPGICKAIKRDDLLSSGLITGSLGYAIGTFMGIGYIYLLGMM